MDGRTEFAGVLVKDRWSSDGSTAHGYVTNEIFPCVDIEKIADYLERIDYYGPFSVEYGIAGNKAFFFEVNLRNDGTSHYFWQGCANIPMAYVCSCAGVGYSDVQTKVCNDGFFIDEIFDYENVLLRRKKVKRLVLLNKKIIYLDIIKMKNLLPIQFIMMQKQCCHY